jgi:2-dehydropantoate 2-reductase
MKIAVMGAGAVGCFYGAMLARAGHAVVLIGRQAMVDAVAGNGLLLESASFTGRVAVEASTAPAAVADAELVLFCVKSYDTESAGRSIAAHLAPGATVLSMQNGVDNAARLSAVLGRAAVPVVVYVATEIVAPGHVRHHGRGDLVIGPSAASPGLAAMLSAAGLPTTVSPKVLDALWAKLIINCAYNGLSAISQLQYGALVREPHVREVMRQVFEEGMAVARAEGVDVSADLWRELEAIAVNMATQRSSTAHDLARGRPGEIDHLNGFVVRRALARGLDVPANLALLCAVKLLEGRSRR